MRFPALHMIDSALVEFRKLAADLPGINSEASAEQAILGCLQMLLEREKGGTEFLSLQIQSLQELLKKLMPILPPSLNKMATQLESLSKQLEQQDTNQPLTQQESFWLDILSQFETIITSLNNEKSIDSEDAKTFDEIGL